MYELVAEHTIPVGRVTASCCFRAPWSRPGCGSRPSAGWHRGPAPVLAGSHDPLLDGRCQSQADAAILAALVRYKDLADTTGRGRALRSTASLMRARSAWRPAVRLRRAGCGFTAFGRCAMQSALRGAGPRPTAGAPGRWAEGGKSMRIGSLAAAVLLSVCSWQAAAQDVGVADLQDFTLKNGQDLADLCGAEPGDELYAEAKQFCYGFLSGVVHFHDALAAGPNRPPDRLPRGQGHAAGWRGNRRRLGDGSPGRSQHDRPGRSRGQGGVGQVGAVSAVSGWPRTAGDANRSETGED